MPLVLIMRRECEFGMTITYYCQGNMIINKDTHPINKVTHHSLCKGESTIAAEDLCRTKEDSIRSMYYGVRCPSLNTHIIKIGCHDVPRQAISSSDSLTFSHKLLP